MAAAAPPRPAGFVLFLHGSGGSGDESRAEVAPYFAAPELAASVRLSFPTAPTAPIACYGELLPPTYRYLLAPRSPEEPNQSDHLIVAFGDPSSS